MWTGKPARATLAALWSVSFTFTWSSKWSSTVGFCLTADRDNNGVWVLYGIASYGYGSCGFSGAYSGFTDVSEWSKLLIDIVEGNSNAKSHHQEMLNQLKYEWNVKVSLYSSYLWIRGFCWELMVLSFILFWPKFMFRGQFIDRRWIRSFNSRHWRVRTRCCTCRSTRRGMIGFCSARRSRYEMK